MPDHAQLRDTLSAVRASCIRAEKCLHLAQEVRPRDLYVRALAAWSAFPAAEAEGVPTTRAGLDHCRSRLMAASAQGWLDRDAVIAASLAAIREIDEIGATSKASWPK